MLPAEKVFHKRGPDWFLLLLDACNQEERLGAAFLETHVLNKLVHEGLVIPAESSKQFLLSYATSLLSTRCPAKAPSMKGKGKK